MKRFLLLFSLSLASFMLWAQQLHTTLDIMHPAEYAISDSVLDLIVVNNMVAQPLGLGHASKIDEQITSDVEIDLSAASTYLLLGATQVLDESRMFASVGFVPEKQNASADFMSQSILPMSKVKQLCYDFQADAALVCNRLLVYDVLGSFLTEDYTYYAYLEAYLVSSWTLQFPNGRYQTFNYKDTLYWEGEADSREAAIRMLPPRQTALLDMAKYAGERFATKFIPTWETVDRYLYENKQVGVQRGMEAFTYQRWDEAIEIWTTVYQQHEHARGKSDKQTAAYAAANTAVAYEIVDNLVLAHEWAEKAVQAFLNVGTADALQQAVNVQYYAGQLTARITENQQ